jgi:hypothetical protein
MYIAAVLKSNFSFMLGEETIVGLSLSSPK